jgi:hypothetical protein
VDVDHRHRVVLHSPRQGPAAPSVDDAQLCRGVGVRGSAAGFGCPRVRRQPRGRRDDRLDLPRAQPGTDRRAAARGARRRATRAGSPGDPTREPGAGGTLS